MAKVKDHVSLQDIADALGVNRSTVSLALRSDPRLPSITHERVRKKAEELGYRQNPLVSAWLQRIRGNPGAVKGATLAFVVVQSRSDVYHTRYYRLMLEGARKEAQVLGYFVDDFVIDEKPEARADLNRTVRVLNARGIRGVLVFDPFGILIEEELALFDQDFAIVVLLRCGVENRYHTVSPDLRWNLHHALHQLEAMGCRRIALAVSPDQMGHHLPRILVPEYLFFQRLLPPSRRVPLMPNFDLPDEGKSPEVAAWVRNARPDAIVTPRREDRPWIETIWRTAGLQKAPYFVMIGAEADGSSGIDNQAEAIGAASALLLGQKVAQNRIGRPAHPQEILLKGRWRFLEDKESR